MEWRPHRLEEAPHLHPLGQAHTAGWISTLSLQQSRADGLSVSVPAVTVFYETIKRKKKRKNSLAVQTGLM